VPPDITAIVLVVALAGISVAGVGLVVGLFRVSRQPPAQ
jgi:hypothetical protein